VIGSWEGVPTFFLFAGSCTSSSGGPSPSKSTTWLEVEPRHSSKSSDINNSWVLMRWGYKVLQGLDVLTPLLGGDLLICFIHKANTQKQANKEQIRRNKPPRHSSKSSDVNNSWVLMRRGSVTDFPSAFTNGFPRLSVLTFHQRVWTGASLVWSQKKGAEDPCLWKLLHTWERRDIRTLSTVD